MSMNQPDVFFALLSRMDNVIRWSKSNPTRRESVSDHSLQVAFFAHCLGLLRNEVFTDEPPVDANYLAVLAMFHDVPELITEDVNARFKYHSQRMLNLCREMEDLANDMLLETVPEPLRRTYEQLLKQKNLEAGLKHWIKAADLLSAYCKSLIELRSGNQEFVHTRDTLEAMLAPYCEEIPEVKYFMQHLAPAFSLTIDEIMDKATPTER